MGTRVVLTPRNPESSKATIILEGNEDNPAICEIVDPEKFSKSLFGASTAIGDFGEKMHHRRPNGYSL